jgi:hypothetical protein
VDVEAVLMRWRIIREKARLVQIDRGSDEASKEAAFRRAKELAKELRTNGNMSDSAAMNMWLRKG